MNFELRIGRVSFAIRQELDRQNQRYQVYIVDGAEVTVNTYLKRIAAELERAK